MSFFINSFNILLLKKVIILGEQLAEVVCYIFKKLNNGQHDAVDMKFA